MKSSAALLLIAIVAIALPAAAQVGLNPTVTVLARASGPVPPECETGTIFAAPRVNVGEPAPVPPVAVPPPSADLASKLRRLQAAAAGDDYDEFNAALVAARAGVAAHPPGGERNAANDAMAVYADINRLWEYANNARTGAFFDAAAENGALLTMLKRYGRFARATADATMQVGGQTVYPTRESRRFLAGEATQRLARLGIRAPEQVARAVPPPPALKPTSPAPASAPAPARSPRKKLRPMPVTHHAVAAKQPAPKPAPVQQRPPAPQPAAVQQRAPVPEPLPVFAPVVTATTAAPPAVTAPPTTDNRQPTTTTPTTAATTTTPATTDNRQPTTTAGTTTTTTTTTAGQEPATTTTPDKPESSGGRVNLLLALILIVVGLGVLIFLFRASD